MSDVRFGVVRTNTVTGEMIRSVTHSSVNHAFLERDGQIIEASFWKTRRASFSKYPQAIMSKPVSGAQADAIWAKAESLLGTPYGWPDICAIALVEENIPTPQWALDRLEGTHFLICSQEVPICWAAGGTPLLDKPPALTTPEDLLQVIISQLH